MKGEKGFSLEISQKEILKSVRIPLPAKTGGRHKDRRRTSRQNQKVSLKKGEW